MGVARLPEKLATRIAGYRSRVPASGRSTATVRRLVRAGAPTLYLKTDAAGALTAELARLRWCVGRIAVPEVLFHGEEDGREFLLLGALEGRDGRRSLRASPELVVRAFGAALRGLHALPVLDCPFGAGLDALLAEAAERVRAGVVDTSDFDEERLGRTASSVLDELLATRPAAELSGVVTHGDACLDNVVFRDGRVSGFLDVGRLGVGDRYRDLALAARDVRSQAGADAVAALWEGYGLAAPDDARLRSYALLDELS